MAKSFCCIINNLLNYQISSLTFFTLIMANSSRCGAKGLGQWRREIRWPSWSPLGVWMQPHSWTAHRTVLKPYLVGRTLVWGASRQRDSNKEEGSCWGPPCILSLASCISSSLGMKILRTKDRSSPVPWAHKLPEKINTWNTNYNTQCLPFIIWQGQGEVARFIFYITSVCMCVCVHIYYSSGSDFSILAVNDFISKMGETWCALHIPKVLQE